MNSESATYNTSQHQQAVLVLYREMIVAWCQEMCNQFRYWNKLSIFVNHWWKLWWNLTPYTAGYKIMQQFYPYF